MVLLFGFEHKHFTMREAFLAPHSISYRYLFADFELRNLGYKIRLRRLPCSQEVYSELLVACWNGYNDRHVAITEIGEIAGKPCQALYSAFS